MGNRNSNPRGISSIRDIVSGKKTKKLKENSDDNLIFKSPESAFPFTGWRKTIDNHAADWSFAHPAKNKTGEAMRETPLQQHGQLILPSDSIQESTIGRSTEDQYKSKIQLKHYDEKSSFPDSDNTNERESKMQSSSQHDTSDGIINELPLGISNCVSTYIGMSGGYAENSKVVGKLTERCNEKCEMKDSTIDIDTSPNNSEVGTGMTGGKVRNSTVIAQIDRRSNNELKMNNSKILGTGDITVPSINGLDLVTKTTYKKGEVKDSEDTKLKGCQTVMVNSIININNKGEELLTKEEFKCKEGEKALQTDTLEAKVNYLMKHHIEREEVDALKDKVNYLMDPFNERHRSKVELETVQRQLSISENEKEHLKNELGSEMQRLQETMEEVQHQVQTAQDDNEELKQNFKEKIDQLTMKLKQVQSQLSMSENEKEHLRKELRTEKQRLQETMEEVQHQLQAAQDENEELQQDLLNKELRFKTELKTVQSQLSMSENEKEHLRKELRTEKQRLQETLEKVQHQLQTAQDENEELQQNFKEKIDQLTMKLKQVQEQLSALDEEKKNVKNERDQYENEIGLQQMEIDRLKHSEASKYNVPSSWDIMSEENFKIVSLPPSNDEYKHVADLFYETVDSSHVIQKIERIQNRLLYEHYQARKYHTKKFPYERKLWHGTSKSAVDSINKNGFDRGFYGEANVHPTDHFYHHCSTSVHPTDQCIASVHPTDHICFISPSN